MWVRGLTAKRSARVYGTQALKYASKESPWHCNPNASITQCHKNVISGPTKRTNILQEQNKHKKLYFQLEDETDTAVEIEIAETKQENGDGFRLDDLRDGQFCIKLLCEHEGVRVVYCIHSA